MRIAIRSFCIPLAFFTLFLCLPTVTSAQQHPTVLAELFRNINCSNCQIADSNYQKYINAHPGQIALINYHNSTGDVHDPFYIASLPASNDRDLYYGGPLNDPDAFIDGFQAGAGYTSEPTWETITTSAIGKAISLQPTVAYGPSGIDTIRFSVTGTSSTQVVTYVAIKESDIYYYNTEHYGQPPGNLWNDVFRTMLPGPKGSSPFSFNVTQNYSIVYNPATYSSSWNEANMSAVVFVQDAGGTHQVEAVGEVSLAGPDAVTETNAFATKLIIPENPLSANSGFQINLAAPGDVQITVYDMLGRKVRTLVDETLPAGETTVDMNGTTLASGAYVARLTVNGIVMDQKKFITR